MVSLGRCRVVRDMTTSRSNTSIVRAIIALGRSLEPGRARHLRSLQCDTMQGYLISRPIPSEQMTGLLKSFTPLHLPAED